jgi:GxxExxY protein
LEKELTETVIGCAMKIHRALGPGFLESVYQNAMLLELRNVGFQVDTQRRLQVKYEGVVVGDFIADLIVNDELILELKTASSLGKADEQQLVNYLKATGIDVGLLLNFGAASLEVRRKVRALSSLPVNPVNPVNPV